MQRAAPSVRRQRWLDLLLETAAELQRQPVGGRGGRGPAASLPARRGLRWSLDDQKTIDMMQTPERQEPDTWHVLVIGLPLAEQEFDLGQSLILRRLLRPLSVFDLAAAGAAGFREWAVLEPLAPAATAELLSPTGEASVPGYDALNKCWLASALLVLRGYARHMCPAVSSYSWNFIAGHQSGRSETFRTQMIEEGDERAVYAPRDSLPRFSGGLLDYHLRLRIPKEARGDPVDAGEAAWIREHFQRFNLLASESDQFRFALEAAIDWRYAGDNRAAISRLWAGIEAIFGIKSELVYRISLLASTVLCPRGTERLGGFRDVKRLYDLRSKAVHGGSVDDEKLSTGIHETYRLLRLLLLDAVDRGSVASEDQWLERLLT